MQFDSITMNSHPLLSESIRDLGAQSNIAIDCIGGAAMSAVYSKAYTPEEVCMLMYPLAYTKIGATVKTSK